MCRMTMVLFEFCHWRFILDMDLGPLYLCLGVVGGWWVLLDYSFSSGPFLSFDR